MNDNKIVILTCENGHSQKIEVDASLGDHFAKELGTLLDGTNPIFKFPPRQFPMEGSMVGRCGICGAWITSEVK